jgi:hypothetical protein
MSYKLVRYQVTVLKTRPRRGFIKQHICTPGCQGHVEIRLCDELATQEWESDRYFGYSYSKHYPGKHFDLWLTNDKSEDIDNFVGFGRIYSIEPTEGGNIYFTQNGKYVVEELSTGRKSPVLLGVHIEPRKVCV